MILNPGYFPDYLFVYYGYVLAALWRRNFFFILYLLNDIYLKEGVSKIRTKVKISKKWKNKSQRTEK